MTSTSAAPEFISKIKSILSSNGIHEPVSEVLVGDSGLIGENFASQTQYITVKFKDDDGTGRKPLNLFVKIKPTDQSMKKIVDDLQLFEKEAMFFREYLPKARHYCKSKGAEELMDIYPKCYFGDGKLLVFENLVKEKGYTLLAKVDKQDFETARLAITNLAKHHAISHALIEEYGGPKYFFRIFPTLHLDIFELDQTRNMFSPNWDNGINMAVKILEKCEGVEGKDEVIEKFRSLKGKHYNNVLESLKDRPSSNCARATTEFRVLNHGDFWNNNMMFIRDKETNTVTHHVLVDFQEVRYASPSVDLAYYLFTSVKPEVRRGRLLELFGIYVSALVLTGKQLGHPIAYSIRELQQDFCKCFQYGFWQGLDTATTAGYEILKEMSMDDGSDASDWATKYNKVMQKWIDEHPEECMKNAENIIEYWKEYERCSMGEIELAGFS